jgi:hypothetical protein
MPQRERVFICYSRKDAVWLARVREQLAVLERAGLISIFDDTGLGAGEDWRARLHQEMLKAKLAVLLVSPPFLTSAFIQGEEIPLLFDRHAKEGMRIYPILVRPCAWNQDTWLVGLQLRPRDAKPLFSLRGAVREQALADIVVEIAELVGPLTPADPGFTFVELEEGPSVIAESEMETQFINNFNDYCEHCAKMMSRATGEVRTVQTLSRGIGDSRAFKDYLSVTADKIVRPSGSPNHGVTLYRRLVVVDAASYESESEKLIVFFRALNDALARAKSEDVAEFDLSCLALCIVHRETMARFFHSNLDVHITAANECALAFQRPQIGQRGPENLWQTCLYASLGTTSNAERLIQSFDQVWSQGTEVLAETVGSQEEQLRAIEHKTLTVLRKIAYFNLDVRNPKNAGVRTIIEKSDAYSNLFFRNAKNIPVDPQVLAPLVREWHAITRAFALQTPQYVALIAKECQKPIGADKSKRFERALQIASSISAGEFGVGVPLSNEIHFRLFSKLSSIVGIPIRDLQRQRGGTWPETKDVIDLFERSFADLHRGAGVLCTIEVTAFHIVDAMSSLFKGHRTSYVDLHLEIEQSHAELADELCNCIRAARDDDDDSGILQGTKDMCDALGRFWGRMADEVFQ